MFQAIRRKATNRSGVVRLRCVFSPKNKYTCGLINAQESAILSCDVTGHDLLYFKTATASVSLLGKFYKSVKSKYRFESLDNDVFELDLKSHFQ